MLIVHKDKILEWAVVVLLLGGVLYAATTAWKNKSRLTIVGEDVKSIKRSMISLLLEDDPGKSGIAKDLVGSTQFLKGIESFKAEAFEAAYHNWEMAAEVGDRDAVYAIAVANESLREKIANPETSEPQREELQRVLESAPEVEVESGVYMLRANESEQ
ncbi:hypothetical protein [Halomonas maura]|uniref:hypothetical protein n=1 Tax=Halomonas maura TaxID=117606 RepID=UPI0025B60688|nr:hypothetical protein [Halomonas maura]MDN3555525.1 hypothetical protein [Halomonas maura]